MEDAYRHDDLTSQIDVPPHRRINVMTSLGGQAARCTPLHRSSSSPILQNLFLGIDTSSPTNPFRASTHMPSNLSRTRSRCNSCRARDIQAPAIPIRWPGSFDVHRTWPNYRPSSTYAHRVLGLMLGLISSLRPLQLVALGKLQRNF